MKITNVDDIYFSLTLIGSINLIFLFVFRVRKTFLRILYTKILLSLNDEWLRLQTHLDQ